MSLLTRIPRLEAWSLLSLSSVHRFSVSGWIVLFPGFVLGCFANFLRIALKRYLSMTGVSLQEEEVRYFSATNRVRNWGDRATFFLQGLSCFHFDCLSNWPKKKKEQYLWGFGCGVFSPQFWLQCKTAKKTANTLMIPKDDSGVILCFIWGDFGLKHFISGGYSVY